ncbi:MAG: DUF4493 domain-containing protein [Bacteroides sp.]|nr:DUF4493 domain-containing protein [Bacteroides sp.]
MKKYLMMVCWMLAGGMLATSCSSDEGTEVPEGMGTVRLTLETGMNYEATTKAVDETPYKNIDNYSKKWYQKGYSDSGEEIWTAITAPEEIDGTYTLFKGSYKIVADYKEEYKGVLASQEGFYSVGESTFIVSDTPANVNVVCEPTHGRMTVTYGDQMATYFDDYKVEISTPKLAADNRLLTWDKAEVNPWYLLVDEGGETVTATIKLTPKAEYSISTTEITRTHTLTPNKAWKLNVNASYEPSNGSLSITITIDEGTNDKSQTIEIPLEWL